MKPAFRAHRILIACLACAGGDARAPAAGPTPGPDPGGQPGPGQGGSGGAGPVGETAFTTLERMPASSAAPAPEGSVPPPERGVEEADVHRIVGTRLFHLNSYRGLLIYDLHDPRRAIPLARLPILGHPVEMFVEGNIIHALQSDALELTKVEGQLRFQRRDVSRLVSIDVGDPRRPRVLATLDITGRLLEGAARKVGHSIYVASLRWASPRWPTAEGRPTPQAWVTSFDVSDPARPRQVAQLPLIEPMARDPQREFAGVSVSGAAGALLVAERYDGLLGPRPGCLSKCASKTVVSILDVSDPGGAIRRQARFETPGAIRGQFKMSYRKSGAGQATFFGVLALESQQPARAFEWPLQNRFESWEVSGAQPRRLGSLSFGSPSEAIPASSFDVERQVVHVSGVGRGDPLVTIDFADPAAPRVLAQASDFGDTDVLRPVGGGQVLLAIGRAVDCRGRSPAGAPPRTLTKVVLSLLDVRRLDRPVLVQRQCLDGPGQISGLDLAGSLDRVPERVGLWNEDELDVLTVPIPHAVSKHLDVGWWYQRQTGVSLLSWDLSRYDPARAPGDQVVLQRHGTVVHADGEVARSIVFRHPVSGERVVINLSDTHLSLANIQDLARPRTEEVVEVAPAVHELESFGEHIVERVDRGGGRWSPQGMAEFRVKTAGGSIEDKPALASFQVGQATSAHRFKDHLVILRRKVDPGTSPSRVDTAMEAVVYDLGDPTRPTLVSRTTVPFDFVHYGFHCGSNQRRGHWFGPGERTLVTDAGLVQLRYTTRLGDWELVNEQQLVLLDLRAPAAPAVVEKALPSPAGANRALVADSTSPLGFYLVHREPLENVAVGGGLVVSRMRYFAQRWDVSAGDLVPGAQLNLPGILARSWVDAGGDRLFLTHDDVFRTRAQPGITTDARLHLLRQRADQAELLDTLVLGEYRMTSLLLQTEDRRVLLTEESAGWDAGRHRATTETDSDRLIILDLAGQRLAPLHDRAIGTYGAQVMGLEGGDLFLQLPGDGVLALDVSVPISPRATRFVRTPGYPTHMQLAGDEAYLAAGHFGVFNFDLRSATTFAAP